MSLWRQRAAIERAVGGLLGPEDEAKLLAHLRRCFECRRYYDALSMQARILAGDPHSTEVSAERELARLMRALNPARVAAEAPARWPLVVVAVALAALVLFGLGSWLHTRVEPAARPGSHGDGAPSPDAGSRLEPGQVR